MLDYIGSQTYVSALIRLAQINVPVNRTPETCEILWENFAFYSQRNPKPMIL